MARIKVALLAAGLAFVAVVGVIVAVRAQEGQPGVYALAQVQEGLARHPAAWLGRVVDVRASLLSLPVPVSASATETEGSVMGYPMLSVADASTSTLSPGAMNWVSRTNVPGGYLVLVRGGADPLRAALRRAPLVGGLAPRPQTLDFFAAAAYRVQLRAAPTTSMACLRGPCYEAVLLDAAPWPSLRYTNFLH